MPQVAFTSSRRLEMRAGHTASALPGICSNILPTGARGLDAASTLSGQPGPLRRGASPEETYLRTSTTGSQYGAFGLLFVLFS